MANFYRSGAIGKRLFTIPSSTSANSFTSFIHSSSSSSPTPTSAPTSFTTTQLATISYKHHPLSPSRTLSHHILPRTVSMAAEITHPTIKGKSLWLPHSLSLSLSRSLTLTTTTPSPFPIYPETRRLFFHVLAQHQLYRAYLHQQLT